METDSQKERRPLEAAYVENPACLGGHTQSSNEARIEQDSPRLAPIPAVAIESRSLRFHEEPVSTVSARDLHKALGVRRVFANWIRPQLARALLVAGHDYTEIVGAYVDANKNASGRPRRDFYLTIDAAKHVAMLAGTSRGRELREFFIEAERQLRTRRMEPAKHAVPETLGEALRLAADLADRNNALTATIHTTRPKALAFERLTDARGSMCISDAAKALHLPPRMLFKWLEARQWIFKRANSWRGYERRVQQGYLTHRAVVRVGDDGFDRLYEQVLVMPSGLAAIARALEDRTADRAIIECATTLASAESA